MSNPFDQFDNPFDQFDEKEEMPEGSAVNSVAAPARAVVQGMAGEVFGGLAGLGSLVAGETREFFGGSEYTPDMAVDTLNRTRDAISFEPETQAGQRGVETLGRGAQFVDELPGTLTGTDATISGGMERARKGLGDTAMDITGSPEAATAAYIIPDAVLSYLGLRGLGAGGKAAREFVPGLFDLQSPTKRRIAQKLAHGLTDADTAPYKLTKTTEELPAPLKANKTKDVINYLRKGGPKVSKDPKALDAIKQGFDKGVVATIKGASPVDRDKMLKMVNFMERGKKNAKFQMRNRPTDIVGDSLMERYKAVKEINREAANRLDGVAKSLQGKPVNYQIAMNDFLTQLRDTGVKLTQDGDSLKPVFAGSRFEGSTQAERIITRLVKRMSDTKPPDAYDVHRLKGFIDEQVDFGKSKGGLTGKAETIVKSLRRGLDQALDQKFPEYNKVNTKYADTRGALDMFDKASGTIDLAADNADKATGVLMRRLMSNVQSRAALINSIDEIQSVAGKYGRTFDDDLMTQVLFADELDSVFGPVARTSFQGQIKQGVEQGVNMAAEAGTNDGLMRMGLKAAGGLVDRARNINEEAAFQSIKDLLSTPKSK